MLSCLGEAQPIPLGNELRLSQSKSIHPAPPFSCSDIRLGSTRDWAPVKLQYRPSLCKILTSLERRREAHIPLWSASFVLPQTSFLTTPFINTFFFFLSQIRGKKTHRKSSFYFSEFPNKNKDRQTQGGKPNFIKDLLAHKLASS